MSAQPRTPTRRAIYCLWYWYDIRRSLIHDAIDLPPAAFRRVIKLHANATLRKPEDLLLDTMDPRSRLGQPLDFREFLPRIAWFGSSLDPSEFLCLETLQ